jgi:hypothetical protein
MNPAKVFSSKRPHVYAANALASVQAHTIAGSAPPRGLSGVARRVFPIDPEANGETGLEDYNDSDMTLEGEEPSRRFDSEKSVRQEAIDLIASMLAHLPIPEANRNQIKNPLLALDGEIYVSVKEAVQATGLSERQLRWGIQLKEIAAISPAGREQLISLQSALSYPNNKRPPGRPRQRATRPKL